MYSVTAIHLRALTAIADRLVVRDPAKGDKKLDAAGLRRLMAAAKQQTGAARCCVVVDHLGLLEAPAVVVGAGDLSADKYRVQLLKDTLMANEGIPLHEQDAVIAVVEVRKKVADPTRQGELTIDDLLGSTRLGYAAHAVLLMEPMTGIEVTEQYSHALLKKKPDKKDANLIRSMLNTQGIAPTTVSLAKGRDGAWRGKAQLEFKHWESTFVPLEEDDDQDIIVADPEPSGPTALELHQAAVESAWAALDEATKAAGVSMNTIAEFISGSKKTAGPVVAAMIEAGKLEEVKIPGKKWPKFKLLVPAMPQPPIEEEEGQD